MAATATDTEWTARLQAIMPSNFMTNTSKTYEAMSGFLDNMIDRIGRTIILGQPNVNNPFDKYTDAVMDYGNAVQKYCVPFMKGKKPDYDPADPNPYKTEKTHPEVQYITFNDDVQYKQTIFTDRLKKAFTSASTMGSFIGEQMQSMYNSAGYDMYIKWKKYLSKTDYLGTDSVVEIAEKTDDEYATDVLKTIKRLVTDEMKYPSIKFNNYAMLSGSPVFDVIMTTNLKNKIDYSLKGVYNLDKVSIPGINIIEVDSFATVAGHETDTLDCVILSAGMAHYTPRSPEAGSLYNPENYYTNFWYKEAGMFSFDPFYNAAHIYKVPVA